MDLLDQLSLIDGQLRDIAVDLNEIKQLHDIFFDTVVGQKQIHTRLDTLNTATRNKFLKIRKMFDDLDSIANGSVYRNQQVMFKKRCQEYLQKFYSINSEFTSRLRQRTIREIQIINPISINDLSVPDFTVPLFGQEILYSSRYGDSTRALRTVNERQIEMQNMERGIEELAQMFEYLNTFVEQQDYNVNQLVEQAEDIVTDLEEGEKQVDKAIKSRRKNRKWLWFLCILVTLIIGGVVLYVLFGSSRGIDVLTGKQPFTL